eukprot:358066-Chlamydomonas_euryale.AAC.1
MSTQEWRSHSHTRPASAVAVPHIYLSISVCCFFGHVQHSNSKRPAKKLPTSASGGGGRPHPPPFKHTNSRQTLIGPAQRDDA